MNNKEFRAHLQAIARREVVQELPEEKKQSHGEPQRKRPSQREPPAKKPPAKQAMAKQLRRKA